MFNVVCFLGRAWTLLFVCFILMSKVDCQVEGSATDQPDDLMELPLDMEVGDASEVLDKATVGGISQTWSCAQCGENGQCFRMRYRKSKMTVTKCRCNEGFDGPKCLQELNVTTTAATALDIALPRGVAVDLCSPNPCENGWRCVKIAYGVRCIDSRVQNCGMNPCLNGGSCFDLDTGFRCLCTDGWSGKTCESGLDLTPCRPNSCFNGGTCTVVPGTNSFKCACVTGFSGGRCRTDQCNPNPCPEGKACIRTERGFQCGCPPGQPCCESAYPCLNGGQCLEFRGEYTCVCPTSFSGRNCETTVSPCAPGYCNNGGTCSIISGVKVCDCPPRWSGDKCQSSIHVKPCDANPCQNEGVCRDMGGNSFLCTCRTGFSGVKCQVDHCSPNPCKNGICKGEKAIGSYSCYCQPGFSGDECQNDQCQPNPCRPGDTCVRTRRARPECRRSNACDPNPCQNGGSCRSLTSTTTLCTCPIGFRGHLCQHDQCNPNPCNNGGTCVREVEDEPWCVCPTGFFGKHCSIDVCAPNPCGNGGQCSYGSGGDFVCRCEVGYYGDRCEIDEQCVPNPCNNGGTCVQRTGSVPGFACLCPVGRAGQTCEERIGRDPCSPNPCANGCLCKESCKHEGGYFCHGENGMLGKRCDIPAPTIVCGPSQISIKVDAAIVGEYSRGLSGFKMFMAPTYLIQPGQNCYAIADRNYYNLTLHLPFNDCGTYPTNDTHTTTFTNTVWINKMVGQGQGDMPIPIVKFSCEYGRQYSVVTSLKPGLGSPVTITSTGPPVISTIELCKVDVCGGKCPAKYSLTRGAVYTVGQKLHLQIIPSMPEAHFLLNDMFLACSESVQDYSTAPVSLVTNSCLPTSSRRYHYVDVAQSDSGICASFEVPMLKGCPMFYIHAKMRPCETCSSSLGPSYEPCQGRRKRSLKSTDDFTTEIYGPIFVFKAANGVLKRITYPGDEELLNFNLSNVVLSKPRDGPTTPARFSSLQIGLALLAIVLVLFLLLIVYNWKNLNAHCGRKV